jgi:RNA polymerase sigma factor (sigma-70 family)
MPQFHDPQVAAATVVQFQPEEGGFAILPEVDARITSRADMADSSAGPAPHNEPDIATAYRAYYSLLEYVAIQKFHVPDGDVPDVIHEVVVAYIRARPKVYDERAWLVGAICNASRLYWRTHGRDAGRSLTTDEDETACAPEDIAQRVDVSTLLRRLPRRCREVLHLRFYEEYSSQEIASHFATTIDYARKMVYRCVSAARLMILDRTRRQG